MKKKGKEGILHQELTHNTSSRLVHRVWKYIRKMKPGLRREGKNSRKNKTVVIQGEVKRSSTANCSKTGIDEGKKKVGGSVLLGFLGLEVTSSREGGKKPILNEGKTLQIGSAPAISPVLRKSENKIRLKDGYGD